MYRMRHITAPKKIPTGDWHKADIVAALRKAGWSLSRLALANGYNHRNTLGRAMQPPGWPKGEEIIAAAIREGSEFPDIQPCDIWPSRYSDTSNSTRRRRQSHVKPVRKN